MIGVFRDVGVVLSFLVIFTLACQATWHLPQRGFDYAMRMLSLAMVFSVLTYAAAASLARHTQPQDYHAYYTTAVALFLLALLTPWRWRRHLPRH